MNTAITKAQLEQAYKMAVIGYTKAYGQVQDTPDGKYCWQGRIDRGYAITARAEGEAKKKMEKALNTMIGLAEKDFVAGELAHAEYVDMCKVLGIEPQEIAVDCQCEYCQRVPKGAELLFAV